MGICNTADLQYIGAQLIIMTADGIIVCGCVVCLHFILICKVFTFASLDSPGGILSNGQMSQNDCLQPAAEERNFVTSMTYPHFLQLFAHQEPHFLSQHCKIPTQPFLYF